MKYLAKDLSRVMDDVAVGKLKIPKKTADALNYWYKENRGTDIDEKYFDYDNIKFYKKDDIRECKDCQTFIFPQNQVFYVDESNAAITRNAPMQCRFCMNKI